MRSPGSWPPRLQYALCLSLVGLALGVRWLINPWLEARAAYITVLCMLMPLAVVVRTGPFVAGGGVGILGAGYLFVLPAIQAAHQPSSEVAVQMGLISLVTLVCGLTALFARRARAKSEGSLRRVNAELDARA